MSGTRSCPSSRVLPLSQNPATEETPEGTGLATMVVAETAPVEVTRAAAAITAEATATATVQVQAAVDLALPGARQAVPTRKPPLT
jgi:hypothetical protein